MGLRPVWPLIAALLVLAACGGNEGTVDEAAAAPDEASADAEALDEAESGEEPVDEEPEEVHPCELLDLDEVSEVVGVEFVEKERSVACIFRAREGEVGPAPTLSVNTVPNYLGAGRSVEGALQGAASGYDGDPQPLEGGLGDEAWLLTSEGSASTQTFAFVDRLLLNVTAVHNPTLEDTLGIPQADLDQALVELTERVLERL